MKAKGLMVMFLISMLAGCASTSGETSGSSGASSGMSHGTGEAPQQDIFRSYIN